MLNQWLDKLDKTEWVGRGELWLDPNGNEVTVYDCKLKIAGKSFRYFWSYEGKIVEGNYSLTESGGTWVDSWHQPEQANCVAVPNASGLFTLQHSYKVPSSPSWGWRSKLSERPTGELVLQMTNITPWGEEGRAVRMIFSQKKNNG